MSIPWIRSRISLVSQEPILFNLTIAQNITYGLEQISLNKVIGAANQANIYSFIEQLPELVPLDVVIFFIVSCRLMKLMLIQKVFCYPLVRNNV